MNDNQRMKSKFRNSKKWKEFRHKKNVEQKGYDPITNSKLRKGCNLHHLLLTNGESEYSDISKEENFILLNLMTHKVVHWIFDYYKKDERVIDRLKAVLDKMLILNGYIEEVNEDLPSEEEILTNEVLEDMAGDMN